MSKKTLTIALMDPPYESENLTTAFRIKKVRRSTPSGISCEIKWSEQPSGSSVPAPCGTFIELRPSSGILPSPFETCFNTGGQLSESLTRDLPTRTVLVDEVQSRLI